MRWESSQGEYYFNTHDNDGNKREVYKYSGRDSIIAECEDSLRRLGTDYIDLYQIHWPDLTTPIEEPMEAFQMLLDQGKIRAAGVSNYTLDQLKLADSSVLLSSNQLPYSMVRREIEEDIVPWCLENDCGILAYSPLQRGLLSGKITSDYAFAPGDSRPDTPYFKKNNRALTNQFLEQIRPIAKEKGATLSQLVIAWTLRQPGITVALAGARNETQVRENAAAAEVELSESELGFISSLLDDLGATLEIE
jgi:aryl-alcohol dehydrogenase-like predicted oxidoreductase